MQFRVSKGATFNFLKIIFLALLYSCLFAGMSADEEHVTPPSGSRLQEEESIIDPPIRPVDYSTTLHVTYSVIKNGTKRKGLRLADSEGYIYNVKRRLVHSTDWQCSVRPKGHPCNATVTEKDDGSFHPGKNGHNHPANVGAATTAKICAAVKERAVGDPFKSATAVDTEVPLIKKRMHTICNSEGLQTGRGGEGAQ